MSDSVTLVTPVPATVPEAGVRTSFRPGYCFHVKLLADEAVISKLTESGTPKLTGQSLLVRISVNSMHSPGRQRIGLADRSGRSSPGRSPGRHSVSGAGDGRGRRIRAGDGDGRAATAWVTAMAKASGGDGLGEGDGLGVGDGLGEGDGNGSGLGDGEVPATRTSTVAVADEVPALATSW